MNVIIDTSVWIEYFSGGDAALVDQVDSLLEHGLVLMSPVVAAELLSGTRRTDQQVKLKAFIGDLEICEHSLAHWLRVGELRARLLAKGVTVSTPDAHLVQAAHDHRARLFSLDKVFCRLAGKGLVSLYAAP